MINWNEVTVCKHAAEVAGGPQNPRERNEARRAEAAAKEATATELISAKGIFAPQLAALATGEMRLAKVTLHHEGAIVERPYMLHTENCAASPTQLESLLREASQLRALRHPGLLHVFAAVGEKRAFGEVALLSELAEAPLAAVLTHNVKRGADGGSDLLQDEYGGRVRLTWRTTWLHAQHRS